MKPDVILCHYGEIGLKGKNRSYFEKKLQSNIRSTFQLFHPNGLESVDRLFGRLVIRLFQVARRFNMPVQPQLVLLQKTLLNIEGLGRQLYPELDLWETAKPFLERWMREQIGPQALFNTVRQELPQIAALLPQLPGLTQDLLQRFQDNESYSQARIREIEALNCRIDRSERRLTGALLGSAVGLSGVLILLFGSEALGSMAAAQGVGTGMCLFGVIVGLYSWLATARRR